MREAEDMCAHETHP